MHPKSSFPDTAHCCHAFCAPASLCVGNRGGQGELATGLERSQCAEHYFCISLPVFQRENLCPIKPASSLPPTKAGGRKRAHSTHCSSYMSLCFSEFLPQPLREGCNCILGGTVKMHHRLWHNAVAVHAEERAERRVLRGGEASRVPGRSQQDIQTTVTNAERDTDMVATGEEFPSPAGNAHHQRVLSTQLFSGAGQEVSVCSLTPLQVVGIILFSLVHSFLHLDQQRLKKVV